MIIPIGVDCGMASFLKKHNLRTEAFPFDWNVTYNGVSKCVEYDFKHFTDPLHNRINDYDVFFFHDFEHDFEEDKEKYARRCNRFIHTLESATDDIIFCRKGHASHHHCEHAGKYSNITSDIDDAERLNEVLRTKYPQLKYKIIVILVCGICFNPAETYKSNFESIEIHSIATPKADTVAFENCCCNIFNIAPANNNNRPALAYFGNIFASISSIFTTLCKMITQCGKSSTKL
jgi:hypothetical protein